MSDDHTYPKAWDLAGKTYDGLIGEAFDLYFERYVKNANQPANTSDLERHENEDYVVLRNVNGPLAVYQVTSHQDLTAKLEEVEDEDWPLALTEEP